MSRPEVDVDDGPAFAAAVGSFVSDLGGGFMISSQAKAFGKDNGLRGRQAYVLGRELYERIATLADHWGGVGKNLNDAVSAYNKAVGSLETRVLVTARKFRDLHAAPDDKDIRDLVPVDSAPRALQALEMQALPRD